jgi:hypothetical protein
MTRAGSAALQELQGALDAAQEFAPAMEGKVGRLEGSIFNVCFGVHGKYPPARYQLG